MAANPRLQFATRALASSRLFGALPAQRCEVIARTLVPATYRRGQVIFQQGDEGDALHLVETGLVRISAESIDGQEAILTEVRPGETFGELAVLDGATRAATATAVVDTTTLRLPRHAFEQLLATDPLFARGIVQSIAHELRRSTRHVGELHFLDLPSRVAARLAQLARDAQPDASREVPLGRYYSQTEIAAMVGTTRQSVNRHLGQLVAEGLIRIESDDIVVIDVDALERRSEW